MKKMKLFAICVLVLAAMLSTSVAMLIPVGAENAPEAKIGTAEYATLEEAVSAAQIGDVIELLSNVTLEDGAVDGESAGLRVNKSLTINGTNNTIFNNNQRGIYVEGGADEQSKVTLTFNDVTVYNHTEVGSVRCFDIRGGHLALTLNNVKVDAANKTSTVAQAITFGGDASNTFPVTVTLTNCEVRSGIARNTATTAEGYDEALGFAPGHYGYAVYACNPVSLTATNTKFDAWAAIYLAEPKVSYGSKTSTVTLDGCEVIATNDHEAVESNGFGTFVIEDVDCTLNIKDTTVTVRTRSENEKFPEQALVLLSKCGSGQATNATVSISGKTVVTGVKDAEHLIWDKTKPAEGESSTGNSVQISGGTYNVAVLDAYAANGYAVTARPDGKGGTVYAAAKTDVSKSNVTALLTAKKNEFYKNNRYTNENRAKIEGFYATATAAVEAATTGSQMNKAVEDFMAAAAAVQAVSMDTIKTEALAKLEAAKAVYEQKKTDYSDEAYAKITKAYEDAKKAIEGATAPETVEVAVATFNDTAFGVATNKPMLEVEKPEKEEKTNAWLIVSAVAGGVVLLALAAVIVVVILKKEKAPAPVAPVEKKPVAAKSAELTDAQRAAMESARRKAGESAAEVSAPAAEEPDVEEVVEQPIEVVEETAEAVAEEIVEEAAEPAPAAEEPTAVSDEKKALFDAFAAIADKSFTERLDSVDPEIKAFYEQVREELLSYDKVKSRLSQKGESFRVGRVLLAKIAISGKTVKCYLALDPTAYDVKTYRHADASERKAFADVPMLVRIRSKLSVKRTAQLIADLAAKNGLVKK